MASQIPASADTAQTDPAGAREETRAQTPAERDLQALDDLIGIGMKLAKAVERVASGEATPAEAAAFEGVDLCLAFSRVARAVRQTVALRGRLADEAKKHRENEADAKRELEVRRARWQRSKGHVEAAVAQAIEERFDYDGYHQHGASAHDTENLLGDLREKLRDPDIRREIGSRPVGEVVEGICRDLGMPVPWSLWRETSWFAREGWEIDEEDEPRKKADIVAAPPAPQVQKLDPALYEAAMRQRYGVNYERAMRAAAWASEEERRRIAFGRGPPRGDTS
ncbi:MAG TPA: hypothetical protein VM689_08600 [Aliidongia sp.]|nr:hypothetical protein [Aliidongia sp.]